MPFIVEESGKENAVPVRLLIRDRLHDRERLAAETANHD